MSRRWRRRQLQEPTEMNITAFMNLMVILVPFLLITAVFSRLTILNLDLPVASARKVENDKPALQLEVILRQQGIEIAEQGMTSVTVAQKGDHYDFNRLGKLLRGIKDQFPEKTDITLLLEPDIAYDDLVGLMDSVRLTVTREQGLRHELFPDISIGDAPLLAGKR